MKIKGRTWSILLAAACAGLLGAHLPAGAEVITIVADEWCPINCEPGAERPGYAIEIARAVLEPAGHTVEYKTLNWSRSIEETRKGKFTAVVGASQEETPDFVFPDAPVGRSANSFFVRKGDSWTFQGLASLEGVRLGVIRDYAYGEELDAYIAEHGKDPARVQTASGDNALEQNLKKLANSRVDVVMEDEPVGRYGVSTLKLGSQVGYCCNDGDPTEFYIAFSPAHPKAKEYAALVSKGIADLRASGRLREILEAYGLEDWR